AVIEARKVKPSVLAKLRRCPPQISSSSVAVDDAPRCIRYIDGGRERPKPFAQSSLAFFQGLLGLFALGDVAGDTEQARNSAVPLAQDGAWDLDPARLTFLAEDRDKTIFGFVATPGPRRSRKGGVQMRQVVWMNS